MHASLERFPLERNRTSDQNSLRTEELEAVSDPIGSETALARLARRARARLSVARRARSGFALIESLVAFVILTTAVAALLQGLGGGARNEARGDFLLRASRQGRSQLEALGLSTPITPGESGGRYPDGLIWRLLVQPIRDITTTDGSGRTTAFLARVTVRRPGDSASAADVLTLTTVKLVLPKPRQ